MNIVLLQKKRRAVDICICRAAEKNVADLETK